MTRKYDTERRGKQPGAGNILLGGGPSSAAVRLVFLVPVGSNEEESVRDAHMIPETHHGKLGAMEYIWDLGDTGSG